MSLRDAPVPRRTKVVKRLLLTIQKRPVALPDPASLCSRSVALATVTFNRAAVLDHCRSSSQVFFIGVLKCRTTRQDAHATSVVGISGPAEVASKYSGFSFHASSVRDRSRIKQAKNETMSLYFPRTVTYHRSVLGKRKNPAAVALGRKGGKKGGPARAASLSAEQRTESARKAVKARWSKVKSEGTDN